MKRDRVLMVPYWRGSTDLPDYSGKNVYGPKAVKRLQAQAHRHIPGLRFVCLTNEAVPGVECVPFQGHDVGGWSRILEAFRPDLHPEPGERLVMVGLDTCITGPCGWLWEWNLSPVGLPLDPYHAPKPCNAVMTWDASGARDVWGEFKASGNMHAYRLCGVPSEMALLRALYVARGWKPLEEEPKRLRSYKVHGYSAEASLIYFHGRPKMDQIPQTDPCLIA